MKRKLLLFFLVLLTAVKTFSQDPWISFEEGKYQEVIDHYSDADLNLLTGSDYNILGSSFYRLGDKSKAEFYYFLGLKRNSRNGELVHNYELVSENKFSESSYKKSKDLITLLFFCAVILCLSLFIFPRWRRNASSSIVFSILILVLLLLKKESTDLNKYILIENPTELKSGIDPNALVYEELPAGEIFRKIDRIGNKVKVVDDSTGRSGWLDSSTF